MNKRKLSTLKLYLCTFLFCTCLIGIPSNLIAAFGEVIITGGADRNLCNTIGAYITGVINALEFDDLSHQREAFSAEGFRIATDLLKKVPMSNASPVQESRLLTLTDGNYEVRNIKVKVEMGETDGSPFQYLVFTVNRSGLISNIRFGMENSHYQHFLEEGEQLRDFAFRQQILQFVEIFRTAYNRRDIDYLRQVYSDDALIIVGVVLQPKPDMPDLLESSAIGEQRIKFIRETKAQYIKRLERSFEHNDFLKVVFDSVEIIRHNKDQYLYGITLKQHWNSSSYSDKGWVFLMIDFFDANHPLIHVRSWQPEPFDDGSVIGLYDFIPIR